LGLNTILSLGHVNGPSLRSGRCALLGHMKDGVLGTLVKIATPSWGVVRYPRCGMRPHDQMEHSSVIRRSSVIFSKGMSTSMFPIQNRSAPSVVTSTERTELYQNHATANKLVIDMHRIRPWYPMGARITREAMKMASRRKNRNLNAEHIQGWDNDQVRFRFR
jgi:hypothetical protein